MGQPVYSALEPQPWVSSRNAQYRHLVVISALTCNLIIVGAVVALDRLVVLLPITGTWQTKLPAIASAVGSIMVGINGVAITALCNAWAKRSIVKEGMTLEKVEEWSSIGAGAVPCVTNNMLIAASLVLATKAFLAAPLVAAFTPKLGLVDYHGQTPLVEFSADSGIPSIRCVYGATYGYGVGCPMNENFGVIYDGGLEALTDNHPVTYTRDGVTYPAELSGISGVISTLSRDLVRSVTNDPDRTVGNRDKVQTCVARTVIDTVCSPTLRSGHTSQITQQTLSIRQPKIITEFQLCGPNGNCDMNTFPDYGYGSIDPFGEQNTDGSSNIFILSSGNYPRDLGSATIDCTVKASEEFVPIEITAGQVLTRWKDGKCPQRSPPNPTWLGNLTTLAQMALQKQQGQDGRLEAARLIPNGTDKMVAFADALTRMVSLGATEAYASLASPISSLSTIQRATASDWTLQQPFTYLTPRYRLGSNQSIYWIAPPILLSILLLYGWIKIGFSPWANCDFNPLDASNMAIAGMNTSYVPNVIREASACTRRDLSHRLQDEVFFFGVTGPSRLGLMTGQSAYAIPALSDRFGGSGAAPQEQNLAYPQASTPFKDESSPFPSPAGNQLLTGYQGPQLGYQQQQGYPCHHR